MTLVRAVEGRVCLLVSFSYGNIWQTSHLTNTPHLCGWHQGRIPARSRPCAVTQATTMPRTALPPTPASSTDIAGQDGTKQLSQLQVSFELPPPAIKPRPASSHTDKMDTPASPESPVSPKAPFRIQPSEAVKSRRRPSAAAAANKDGNFALPPPPTRSRKIIQMKPRPQEEKKPAETATANKSSASTSVAKKNAAVPAASETGPAKKKQPSASSAAGRKIARKTAHSLIERRRRSKMNEEFAVLKDMIPACTGEMHKLAILQVSNRDLADTSLYVHT